MTFISVCNTLLHRVIHRLWLHVLILWLKNRYIQTLFMWLNY